MQNILTLHEIHQMAVSSYSIFPSNPLYQYLSALSLSDPSLIKLSLPHSKMSYKAVSSIATALEKNTILTHLDLSCNPICAEGAKSLAAALEYFEGCVGLKECRNARRSFTPDESPSKIKSSETVSK